MQGSWKATESPKELSAHKLRGPGHTRTAGTLELASGLGLLSALRYRVRTKSLAAQESWEYKHYLSMQNYQGCTGSSKEQNSLRGPAFANVVPQ